MKVVSQDGTVYQEVTSCCIRRLSKDDYSVVTHDSKELLNNEKFILLGNYKTLEEAKKELLNFALTESKGNKPLYFFRG